MQKRRLLIAEITNASFGNSSTLILGSTFGSAPRLLEDFFFPLGGLHEIFLFLDSLRSLQSLSKRETTSTVSSTSLSDSVSSESLSAMAITGELDLQPCLLLMQLLYSSTW